MIIPTVYMRKLRSTKLQWISGSQSMVSSQIQEFSKPNSVTFLEVTPIWKLMNLVVKYNRQ